MQQVYGLDVSKLDVLEDAEAERIAMLCAQLPADARVRVMDDPDAAWDDSTRLMRAVDYRIQVIVRMLAGKGPKPKPAQTPGEAARARRMVNSAAKNRTMVDEALGFSGTLTDV